MKTWKQTFLINKLNVTFFYSASDCRHSHLRIEVYELLKSTFQYIHIPFGLCCRAAWRVCPEMFDPLRVFNVNSNPWRDIGYSWSVIHSGNVEKCSPKYFQEKGFLPTLHKRHLNTRDVLLLGVAKASLHECGGN